MASTTVNRAWLKRQIEKGGVTAKCDHRLTDDYRFDVANDFGKTGWLPARILNSFYNEHGRWDNDSKAGHMNLLPMYFEGYGRAYRSTSDPTLISLYVHSNLSFSLRLPAGK